MDDIEDTNYKFYSQDIENIWYIFFCGDYYDAIDIAFEEIRE